MSVTQFEEISLIVCVGGLIAFMVFIMWDLAKKSKAGRLGTFVLFTALGVGLLGFVIKTVMTELMDK